MNQSGQQTHNPAAAADASPVQVFADNRESAAIQRHLMATMANSPQAIAQRQISQQIHNSPRMLAQRKMLSGESVQRVEKEEERNLLCYNVSRKKSCGRKKTVANSPAQLEQQSSAKPNNTGLPDNLKTGIANRFPVCPGTPSGFITTRPTRAAIASACAQGTDIHVAPGQEQHLPHEAWHVVQQAQGRVQPTLQMAEGTPINDDRGLEQEADIMGAKAAG